MTLPDQPEQAVPCPNCRNPMVQRQVELFYRPHPVQIDACPSCNLLWFDQSECISMTPRSVLELFQFLNQSGLKPNMPLSGEHSCPRCAGRLDVTHNIQRATRYTYWRCPSQHGELYTFNQFLLNKNFIRSPSPEELANLRKLVRQISCSQCGGPIDLFTDAKCSHCGSAIAMIDPDGIAKAVHELQAADAKSSTASSEAEIRAALIMVHNESLQSRRPYSYDSPGDLLSVAMSAVTTFLAK